MDGPFAVSSLFAPPSNSRKVSGSADHNVPTVFRIACCSMLCLLNTAGRETTIEYPTYLPGNPRVPYMKPRPRSPTPARLL